MSAPASLYKLTDAQVYLCVAQSIQGDIMLNPIEKFKVAILHLNRAWNHWTNQKCPRSFTDCESLFSESCYVCLSIHQG